MKGVEAAKDYSQGLMLFTSFQWDESELEAGDQLGLCFFQDSGELIESSASCWTYDYAGDGFYSGKKSY